MTTKSAFNVEATRISHATAAIAEATFQPTRTVDTRGYKLGKRIWRQPRNWHQMAFGVSEEIAFALRYGTDPWERNNKK